MCGYTVGLRVHRERRNCRHVNALCGRIDIERKR